VKYYSQLEIEKFIEFLYDAQCENLTDDQIESNTAILKTRKVLVFFQGLNHDMLDSKIDLRVILH
jgi:hypothetical protein